MNALSPAGGLGSPAKAHDAPPHDELEAIVWVIDKYIQVCEWESVVACFNECAASIATGNPVAYIKCIRHAFVAIVNCQNNRCAQQRMQPPLAVCQQQPHPPLSALQTRSLLRSCACARLQSAAAFRRSKAARCKPPKPAQIKPHIPSNSPCSYLAAHYYNCDNMPAAADILVRIIESGLVCSSGAFARACRQLRVLTRP